MYFIKLVTGWTFILQKKNTVNLQHTLDSALAAHQTIT